MMILNLFWKLFFSHVAFFEDDLGGTGGGGGGGEGNNQVVNNDGSGAAAVEDPKPTTPIANNNNNNTQPDLPTLVAKAVGEALKPIIDRISTTAPTAPVIPAINNTDEIDQEIDLRKRQLTAVKAGEIDAKYEPEILARLSEAQARKVGREMVGAENEKTQFYGEWNKFLNQAFEEFPELKDQTSELFKEAKALVEADPSYRKYVEANRGGKVNFKDIDPRVNLRAAREAYAIVQKRNAGKPLVHQQNNPKPGLARTGLEGGRTTPPAANDELDKLEREAAESGDPLKWQQLIKARDTAAKARK